MFTRWAGEGRGVGGGTPQHTTPHPTVFEHTPIGDVCLLCGLFGPPGWGFDVTANLTAADENDMPSRILGMLSQPSSSVQAIFLTLSLTVV